MTKTELLNKYAPSPEMRILLGRVLDKLELAEQRSVPAHTVFLSTPEQAAVQMMLQAWGKPRYFFFGGFPEAERQLVAFLPDWQQTEDWLADPDGPVAALRATYQSDVPLTHRDFLGALMGLGITREKIGDILVEPGRCDILVMRDALPILLTQLESAGRYQLKLSQISLADLVPKQTGGKLIRDTVATLRLDAVASCGFSLSRAKAADLVSSGRIELNHRDCAKPDRLVAQGDTLTCRGMGKCVVKECSQISKKGRVMLVLERYI